MNFILSPLMYYFTRHAFLYLITVLSILCLIASLSELVEYSKQMPNLVDNSFYICLKMTLYKLPINIQNLLPYSFYFGSIMSLLKLSKNSELTIARASGLNIWYCCLPHIILAFLIGIFSGGMGIAVMGGGLAVPGFLVIAFGSYLLISSSKEDNTNQNNSLGIRIIRKYNI